MTKFFRLFSQRLEGIQRNIPFSQEKQKRKVEKSHWKDVIKSKKGQSVDHMTMNRRKEISCVNDDEWFTKEQAVDKL